MGEAVPVLTLAVLAPLCGVLLCLVLRHHPGACRAASLAVSGAVFAALAWLFITRGAPSGGWIAWEDFDWVPAWGIRFTLGLDGLSLLLCLLTGLLLVLSVLLSFRQEEGRTPLFHALLLTMESGILGVFLAQDLFLFYLFWEVMLIPMFFLIGIWGHGRKVYAAVKFFLFTLAGSLLMLLAILALFLMHGSQTGEYTFSLQALRLTQVPPGVAPWLFGAFLLAFAVKVPLFPVHTWLPDAHTEAPTAGSVILAGLLLKTGVYGLLRFGFPLFPEQTRDALPWLSALGLVGVFYGAWVAYAQRDAKRLVAYSSVAHLGLVVLGLSAWNLTAWEGSILQCVNHGISTGALFAMLGMIYQRAHTRELRELGGLWSKAPRMAGFFLFFCLSSMGLPGLNNFTGEFLILVGVFQSHPWLGAAAAAGMVFAAAYMLRLILSVVWGPVRNAEPFADLTPRELLVLVPLAGLVLWLGLHPATFQGPVAEVLRGMLISAGGAP